MLEIKEIFSEIRKDLFIYITLRYKVISKNTLKKPANSTLNYPI